MRVSIGMLVLLLTGSAWAETVIHAGKLFDAAAGRVIDGATIVVEGERIQSVQAGFAGEPRYRPDRLLRHARLDRHARAHRKPAEPPPVR